MNSDNGRIGFRIELDNTQLNRDIKKSRQAFRDLGNQVESECSRMDYGLRNVGKAVTAYFTVTQVFEFGRAIINTRKEIESLEISFDTLLGSKPKATAFFNEIRDFAVKTPLQLNDIARAAQTLLGFGVSAEKVMPILRQLGDVSMGNAERFKSLALAFAQATSAGRLQGQDLLQMINAGFNPLNEIAKKTGKSIGELKDDMSKGKISAQDLADALDSATAQGGQFYGMLEKQSKGIEGALSNLEGAWNDALNEIGTSAQGVFTESVELATVAVRNYDKIAAALGVIATAYGVNKAALALYATASNAAVSQEIAIYNALLPVKDKESASDVQQISASRGISQAKAQEVLAVRARLAAYKDELSARIANLTALKAEINSQREAVAAKIANAEIAIALAKEEQALALTNGDLLKSNAAGERLTRAEKQKTILVEREVNLSKAASNVQTQINTVTTEANTVATTLNTGAQAGARKQAGLLALAYNSLKKGIAGVTAYLSANPYLLMSAAVAAAAYGIYKLVTYQTDYEKSLKRLDEAEKDLNVSLVKQQTELDRLFANLKNAKEGTEGYKTARDAIMSKYGSYLGKLGDEKTALDDIATAYRTIQQEIRNTAKAKAMGDFMEAEESSYATKAGESRKRIYDIVKGKYGNQAYRDGTSVAEDVFAKIINALDSGQKLSDDFVAKFDEKARRGIMDATGNYRYVEVTANKLRDALSEIGRAKRQLDAATDEARVRFGAYDSIKSEPDSTPTIPATYAQEVARLKEERAKLEDEIKQLKSDKRLEGMPDNASVLDAIEEREKRINEINARLGVKASEKADKERLKAEEKSNEALLKMQEQNTKDRISLMHDGAEKEKAQVQAEYDTKIREIAKQEKEWREAQKGTLTKEQESALDTVTAHAAAKYQKDYDRVLQEESRAMNEYLKEYGTYLEKRNAIIALYDEQIANAPNAGTVLRLERERTESLRSLSLDAFKESDLYMRAFGDMESASDASIDAIITKLKDLRDATVRELEPAELKEYNDAIRRAEDELLSRKDVFERYRVSLERYNEALARQRELEEIVNGARNSGDGTVITGSETKLVDGVLRVVPVVKTLEEAQEDVRKATDGTTDAYKRLKAAAKETVDVTQELLRSISDTGNQLSGLGDAFDNSGLRLMGSLLSGAGGIASGGLSAVDAIGTAFAKGADGNYLTGGLGGTLTRISSVIGGVGAAIQGVQMISGLVGTFKTMADKDNEERIEELQESIEALTESNEELQCALEDQFSVTARDNLAEQNRNLQQQQALIQQQIAEEQGKKDPDDARVEEWQKQLRDINRQIEENKQAMIEALTGTSTKEAITSFSDGLVGAWENHTDAVKASVTTARSLIRNGLIQYLNDQMSGLGKAFNENLAAALEDGFISTWEDAQLMAQAEQIASQGELLRERFAKYLDASGESSVSGSGNAASGMSQDTGDAIEGRMTAMQIAVEAIRGQGEASNMLMQSLQDSFSPLVTASVKNSMTLSELHGLALLAIDYLDTIARNTGELAGIKRHLARIEQNTNNL